tara:strand:+ start:579 stop:839 length:261 start_codon:yes stop_codon:yes gene_type:complete
MNIETTKIGCLHYFEIDGEDYEIHRGADLSNLYIIKNHSEDVALAVWTSPRNEFAISSNSFVHLPYVDLIEALREANTKYMESIKQ